MEHASLSADFLRQLGLAAGTALAIILAVWLLKPIVARKLGNLSKRTNTKVDDAILATTQATRIWLVSIVAIVIGAQFLQPDDSVQKLLKAASTVAIFAQLGLWITALFAFWLNRARERALASNVGAATSLSAMAFVGELVIWTTIALVALDNLGVNITTLIAGLGVGGVAVALAVQNILGDLFASLSIVIDKPFVIGDFIIVDTYMGTVENVGLKTTRIRSLDGEQIIFANSDLLKNRVRNYKRMQERRVIFSFGVVYQTRTRELKTIPGTIRQIVERQKGVRFERAHCSKFAESSIDFETVYWMTTPDYNTYMDTQQEIIFSIKSALEDAGIEFAHPSRNVFIHGNLDIEAGDDAGDDEPAPSKRAPTSSRRVRVAPARKPN